MRSLSIIGAVLVLLASAAAAMPPGHIFFSADFESADAIKAWVGRASLDKGYQSERSLCIEVPSGSPGAICATPLPAEAMRGHSILISARVRAENVTPKPEAWNGIKLMLAIDAPSGKTWPQANLGAGTFDWQKSTFAVRVPRDARSISLCIGLEKVTGKVWFDDIRITVRRPPPTTRPQVATGPINPGHGLPRLRGTMISPQIDAASLQVLGQDWNANLIRWQLIRPSRPGLIYEPSTYDQWLEAELKKLDAALPLCRKFGLMIVVDLHSPPGGVGISGGYVAANAALFSDKSAQAHFVEVWRKIAARYKDEKIIWGFDLVNEPVEDSSAEGLDDWRDLAERAAKAIRAIDSARMLIVEPADWGGPQGLADFDPLDMPNIVYSVHMYLPHAFTHQSVYKPVPPISYPGMIDGKRWDKSALEAALKPVVDFQKTYNVPIYIGEFSAIRWAPGDSAHQYLSDLIDIFEQHGWDWSYHAFREWNGWSVEHGPDRADAKPTTRPTARQLLLRSWFSRNRKPSLN